MTETTDAPLNVPTSGVRDALGEVRDMDEGKREALVSIPWEVLDTYRSDFSRDCFDDYLGQRMPVVCWQHRKDEPIGRAADWQKGARANEFVLRFSDFEAVPRARQAYAQMRDGDITDVSFYYDQAKAIAHPNTRGAIRFTKARMPEISPVTVGAIPGAAVTGVRQAADAAGIAELVRSHVISEEEGREMLGLAGTVPSVGKRESITVSISAAGDITATGSDAETFDVTAADGERADDAEGLALAVATALAATRSAAPESVAALIDAAAQANEDLLGVLGVDDDRVRAARELAPVGDDGDRSAKEPYGDVEYADPGYQDDKQKRYPIDTADHVRSALAYIGQSDNATKYSADDLAKVKANIAAAAKKFGIKVSDDGKRAAEGVDIETQAALARMSLGRR
jgi:HK97 family phage prohead protease